MVHRVAGEDEQRPVRTETEVEQPLPDGPRRVVGLPVAHLPPAAVGGALRDEDVPRIERHPLPEGVQHAGRVLTERFGGAQQHRTVGQVLTQDVGVANRLAGVAGAAGVGCVMTSPLQDICSDVGR